MARKPVATKPKARRPRRKKVAAASRGLEAHELGSGTSAKAQELAAQIAEDGGAALALYREPLAGHDVILASLPIEKVEPTPYQRDVSEPHVKRLADAIERVGRYLDPIVTVRIDGRYVTPNGGHRLAACRLLGTKAIVALVLPEPETAYQILALNTEKAHNIKERSLATVRRN
jgi:ParB family chromosome partitioning protein